MSDTEDHEYEAELLEYEIRVRAAEIADCEADAVRTVLDAITTGMVQISGYGNEEPAEDAAMRRLQKVLDVVSAQYGAEYVNRRFDEIFT
jgi:hypothetical protein